MLCPWPKVTQILKLKLVFFSETVGSFEISLLDSTWESGNENLYK